MFKDHMSWSMKFSWWMDIRGGGKSINQLLVSSHWNYNPISILDPTSVDVSSWSNDTLYRTNDTQLCWCSCARASARYSCVSKIHGKSSNLSHLLIEVTVQRNTQTMVIEYVVLSHHKSLCSVWTCIWRRGYMRVPLSESARPFDVQAAWRFCKIPRGELMSCAEALPPTKVNLQVPICPLLCLRATIPRSSC
jgi:hypothetical protein